MKEIVLKFDADYDSHCTYESQTDCNNSYHIEVLIMKSHPKFHELPDKLVIQIPDWVLEENV